MADDGQWDKGMFIGDVNRCRLTLTFPIAPDNDDLLTIILLVLQGRSSLQLQIFKETMKANKDSVSCHSPGADVGCETGDWDRRLSMA